MTTIATSVLPVVSNIKEPRRGKAVYCCRLLWAQTRRRGCQFSLSRSLSLSHTSNKDLCKSELASTQQTTYPDKSEPLGAGFICISLCFFTHCNKQHYLISR